MARDGRSEDDDVVDTVVETEREDVPETVPAWECVGDALVVLDTDGEPETDRVTLGVRALVALWQGSALEDDERLPDRDPGEEGVADAHTDTLREREGEELCDTDAESVGDALAESEAIGDADALVDALVEGEDDSDDESLVVASVTVAAAVSDA